MAASQYDAAIDPLEQALLTHSFLDGLYQRLDLAYTAVGRWKEARQAMEAAHLRDAAVIFKPWSQAADTQGLPDVVEWTWEAGLGDCRHEHRGEIDRAAPGVAVADLTGDEHLEIICLGGLGTPTRVYRRHEDSFSQAFHTGLEESLHSQGVYVVDVTGNGLPDVIVTGVGDSRLYRNEGNLHFQLRDLPLPEMWASAVAAADFTGNGQIDLVVGGWIGKAIWNEPYPGYSAYEDSSPAAQASRRLPNPDAPLHLLNVSVRYGVPLRLLEGDGTGGFKDVTEHSGVDVRATTLNVELIDVSGYGHLDLVVINDSMPARLFLGDG